MRIFLVVIQLGCIAVNAILLVTASSEIAQMISLIAVIFCTGFFLITVNNLSGY